MRFYTVITVPPEVPTLAEALNDAKQAGWRVLQILTNDTTVQLVAFKEVDRAQFDALRLKAEGATSRVVLPDGEER